MLTTLFVAALLAQSQPAAPAHIDMAQAKRLFDTGCAGCHGPEGRGGKGPSLNVPKLRHVKTDGELVQLILVGLPGTEMPPSWYLGDKVALVVAYVRSLGAGATPARVEGDIAKGQALYDGKGGCAHCHTMGGAGHAYGPDLADIGARRTAASLRESLINPGAEIAPEYLQVHVVTRQGTEVTGVRRNEDSFTIQILDSSGHFHSFRKADLSTIEKRADQSPMPSYQRAFSETELQDLIAYLSSLRGEQ